VKRRLIDAVRLVEVEQAIVLPAHSAEFRLLPCRALI
jgi:hypothetical protein